MFDQEFTIEALTGMGNPLTALKEVLDFEQFRPILEPVFAKENRKSNAGRRGLDPVFMMKVMFLQRLYGFGDKQIEYQILDRMSFREFLDIKSMDDVPDEKTRLGDLEGDTIIGKNHKGAIVTINDRLTGFSWSAQLEDKGADNVADANIQMLMPFKGYLHTLTFDNGREFAHHEKVSEALGISIFFAKPYHSWERGANENTNGLYRQYIPKGTDFQTLDKDILPTARLMLNTRPRKSIEFYFSYSRNLSYLCIRF